MVAPIPTVDPNEIALRTTQALEDQARASERMALALEVMSGMKEYAGPKERFGPWAVDPEPTGGE